MAEALPVPERVVIAIDAGTSGVKAAAFGIGSPWSAVAIREYPLIEVAPGREEQDPYAIVNATQEALRECATRIERAAIVGLSVSAAMHGLMALDADHRPLTRLVTWADNRARLESLSIRESGVAGRLHALTGVPVHPMSPFTKLAWFRIHDPSTWAKATWWVGLKEYLLWWLTGSLVTEVSSASGTGLMDETTLTWSREACDACGVSPATLPAIVSPTAVLRLQVSAARSVGLPDGLPVVAGAADGPLASLGVGAIDHGVAAVSLGTSGAVRVASDQPLGSRSPGLFSFALTESKWIVGGAVSNGGVVLRWAADALGEPLPGEHSGPYADHSGPDPQRSDPETMLQLASTAPPGSDGLVMLPYLLPERSPLWDPDLPGAYLGLRKDHTRAHLVRAAMEGVCLHISLVVDEVETAMGIAEVRATGGAFRSQLWRDLLAASLRRRIQVSGDAEGTARGAAALGLFALGEASSLEEATERLSPSATSVVVEPLADLVKAMTEVRARVPYLAGRLAPMLECIALSFGAD